MKKIIAIFTAVVMAMSATATVTASAEEATPKTGELKLITQNVAGLPIPSMFSDDGKVVPIDTKEIGRQLNENDFDILGVQEDFNFHFLLSSQIDRPYKTFTMGGIPAGDGLNIYSKYPIYNVERHKWDKLYGVFDGLQDELTPKGYIHCLIELSDDVYIDYYVLHMDAGGDPGSVEARHDNYRQLMEDIQNRDNTNRAMILCGDFNSQINKNSADQLYPLFIKPLDLKDCFAEFALDGNYDLSEYHGSWKEWDSIDRFMYKDGTGVDLEVTDFGYKQYQDEKGHDLSDHSSAYATISYSITDDAKENLDVKTEKFSLIKIVKNYIVGIFHDLKLFWNDRETLIKSIKKD